MVNLFTINPHFHDATKVGRLKGHISMITSIATIENTPMVISADDLGTIKVWDIRQLRCIQSIELGGKAIIHTIIDMSDKGKVAYISTRINFFDFEDPQQFKKEISGAAIYPIYAEYNIIRGEIILGTRKDVRFIDIYTGKTKKIYKGLTQNKYDDITVFKIVQQNKKFIIGDEKGNIELYSYATGEKIKRLKCHSKEVSQIAIDFTNKLFLSVGWDSYIYIQREEGKLKQASKRSPE